MRKEEKLMAKITAEKVSLCGDRYLGEPYERVDCQALWELMLKAAGLTVNLAGDPVVDLMDLQHLLFTGDRYTPLRIRMKW